ncbi:RsbRD N-terminal domain-containing protein [Chloroflexota bacterium]
MVLEHVLVQKKAAILEKWFQMIVDTYPADTAVFFKRVKDRFANPVGYTISREIKNLYEELLHDINTDRLASCLDNIIRIRAVQDFPPSQAIAFIFLLKKAVREELAGELGGNQTLKELLKFESKVDEVVLLAVDTYMRCREKVFEIRVNEVKDERQRAFKLLEKMNAIPLQSEVDYNPKDRGKGLAGNHRVQY